MKFLKYLMENKITLNSNKSNKFSWEKIQTEMKDKFGKIFMIVGLRKLLSKKNLIIIYYYQLQHHL